MPPVTVTRTEDPIGNVTYTVTGPDGSTVAALQYNTTIVGAQVFAPAVSAFLAQFGS